MLVQLDFPCRLTLSVQLFLDYITHEALLANCGAKASKSPQKISYTAATAFTVKNTRC